MDIFLLEDDEAIGIGLTYSLENEGYKVTLAKNIKQAEKIIDEKVFSLYILDLTLPDGSGYDICKKVKAKGDLPVIFLTAYDDEVNVIMGFELGADDYITKPFRIQELRARVAAHLRREKREHHSTLSFEPDIRFDLSAKVLYVSEQPVPLTKSEYSICEYLAKNRGQVFTKEQIYEAVFGFDGIGDNSTISTHIKNIRAKLEHFKISPISTVWGIGYKWE